MIDFCSEPISGTKPKFSSKSDHFGFQEKSERPLALLCPAQGSPTPTFRFKFLFLIAIFKRRSIIVKYEVGTKMINY